MIFNASKPKASMSIPTSEEILSAWELYDFESELNDMIESGETSGGINIDVDGSILGVAIATRSDTDGTQAVNVLASAPYLVGEQLYDWYQACMFISLQDNGLCVVVVTADSSDNSIIVQLKSVNSDTDGFSPSINDFLTQYPGIYIKTA